MTNDFSDPTLPIPDFPYGDPADGGGTPQVHSKETSVQSIDASSYRSFSISSCRRDVEFAASVYQGMDDADGLHRRASFEACRTSAWFVRHRDTGEIRVASSRCKMRWCPMCIKSRRYVITRAATEWMVNLDRPKFLTLTLKHSSVPLAVQVRALYGSFREIRRSKWWKKNVRGGIWFFQIKRSTDGKQWHPHLHILLDSKFIPKEQLSERWKRASKGSFIIDIRAIHDQKKAAEYVARYAAAPCRLVDFEFVQAVNIMQTMHHLRIVGTFGSAKGVKLTAKKPADAESWERLCDFYFTAKNRETSETCDIIWQAWRKGEKCPISPEFFKPPPDPQNQTVEDEPETFRQFVFNFNEKI